MTEIQAVLAATKEDVTIAYRDWEKESDGIGGVFDLSHESITSLQGVVDDGTGVEVVGDVNTSNKGDPRLAVLRVTIDGDVQNVAARGFSYWGAHGANARGCWVVHGMTEAELADLRAIADTPDATVEDIQSDKITEAEFARFYGDEVSIEGDGGSQDAVDASSAVDGDV